MVIIDYQIVAIESLGCVLMSGIRKGNRKWNGIKTQPLYFVFGRMPGIALSLRRNMSTMIGVFDSGFGGLTILSSMRKLLPEYDYLYLGDNARAPYGSRSFEVIYDYTCQAVEYLFAQGCELVILACNTASAKALRTIQQVRLPQIWQQEGSRNKRVLGIIRPTAEVIGQYTHTGHVAVLATEGTVASDSYRIEISKQFPNLHITQQACPMWVPLVENDEYHSAGADYFVHKYIDLMLHSDKQIDTVLLACTHYPLLLDKIRSALPADIRVMVQGDIVARSLADYLQRHSDLAGRLEKGGRCRYLSTEQSDKFGRLATLFMQSPVEVEHIVL